MLVMIRRVAPGDNCALPRLLKILHHLLIGESRQRIKMQKRRRRIRTRARRARIAPVLRVGFLHSLVRHLVGQIRR